MKEEGLYFTIALSSALSFQPSPPSHLWWWFIPRWEADTLRRDTLQPLEPRILERSLFHPFFAVAAGKRRPEVVEGGLGRTMPLHCTGWVSLLRARRAGDLGANARNRSVRPSPSPLAGLPCLTRGCNAPCDSPLLLLGARVHRQRARGAVTLPGLGEGYDFHRFLSIRFSIWLDLWIRYCRISWGEKF